VIARLLSDLALTHMTPVAQLGNTNSKLMHMTLAAKLRNPNQGTCITTCLSTQTQIDALHLHFGPAWCSCNISMLMKAQKQDVEDPKLIHPCRTLQHPADSVTPMLACTREMHDCGACTHSDPYQNTLPCLLGMLPAVCR
jgi:hypothetical protein